MHCGMKDDEASDDQSITEELLAEGYLEQKFWNGYSRTFLTEKEKRSVSGQKRGKVRTEICTMSFYTGKKLSGMW